MMTIAEISAAPHFPHALRSSVESNAVASFVQALSDLAEIQVIEENGELRLVSHAAS